ncbi:hypothetical protein KIN20_031433 [Parelaphostrongylus tenuis]|uniref:Uncharacterized protein n=1 Tax=Parelaphostrongylus tenuis TaxID=148309 RepID=A0AAD5R553_PARTN|nr:hypothetical protein KIN20_031433 [Parelaphostrongylus tenuis]
MVSTTPALDFYDEDDEVKRAPSCPKNFHFLLQAVRSAVPFCVMCSFFLAFFT